MYHCRCCSMVPVQKCLAAVLRYLVRVGVGVRAWVWLGRG